MQDYARAGQSINVLSNQQTAANGLTQPKELGVLQRVDGMRSGLQELRARLERFFDRIDENAGEGSVKGAGAAPIAASLSGTLMDAETELRTCLHLADTLHDRF